VQVTGTWKKKTKQRKEASVSIMKDAICELLISESEWR
jgi:hypothetical protein